MRYLRQISYNLHTQPVTGIVSIIGTAFSIFLIMVVVSIQDIPTLPFAPESNRGNMLVANGMHVESFDESMMSCGSYSFYGASTLYKNLASAKASTVFSSSISPVTVSSPGQGTINVNQRSTDADYWQVFDHTFISGAPYDSTTVGLPESNTAVISESVARAMTGATDVEGMTLLINYRPVTVCGVVKDVSPFAENGYSQIWMPLDAATITIDPDKKAINRFTGNMRAVVLSETGEDFATIKREINDRYHRLNARLQADSIRIIPHGQPYTFDEVPYAKNNSNDPDYSIRNIYWIAYVILLLVPAINLSNMTQSRLNRRKSEIGIRRAFGCTRATIIRDLLVENMLVTFIGGVIGFILSRIFVALCLDMFFTPWKYDMVCADYSVEANMLFNWSTFGFAIFFCLMLNLLSAFIPAWKSSRVNPVEAITRHV